MLLVGIAYQEGYIAIFGRSLSVRLSDLQLKAGGFIDWRS